MSYQCPLHNWIHLMQPCPGCCTNIYTASSDSTTDKLQPQLEASDAKSKRMKAESRGWWLYQIDSLQKESKNLMNQLAAAKEIIENQTGEILNLKNEIETKLTEECRLRILYEEALRLIASPKREDGTYNRSREACEKLAKEALAEK